MLDVTFWEDDSQVRDRTAARNLALMRKIALNLLGRDRSRTASVGARRKRAAWNDEYMFQLLAGSSQPLAQPRCFSCVAPGCTGALPAFGRGTSSVSARRLRVL